MRKKHTTHTPGTEKDGGEWINGKEVMQRFWCKEDDCYVSIPVVVRTVK